MMFEDDINDLLSDVESFDNFIQELDEEGEDYYTEVSDEELL